MYKCVISKSGQSLYYKDGKRIAKSKIPNNKLPNCKMNKEKEEHNVESSDEEKYSKKKSKSKKIKFSNIFTFKSVNFDLGAGGVVYYDIKLLKDIGTYKCGDKFIFATLRYDNGKINLVKDENGEEEITLKPTYK
jgi:hypothetical protein